MSENIEVDQKGLAILHILSLCDAMMRTWLSVSLNSICVMNVCVFVLVPATAGLSLARDCVFDLD